MRSPRLLGLIALTVPVLLLPAACEDSSSSSSGGTFSPEAGPGFDAGGNPDTSVPPALDAAVDQFVPPRGVTVKVLDAAGPKSAIRVIAHDASGAVTGDAMTDATGKVAFATAPSIVSVLASFAVTTTSTRYTPVTFMAVADGDNLVVVVPVPFVQPAPLGTFNVGFPQGGLGTTATAISVYSNGLCYGSSTNTDSIAAVVLYDGCANAQNAVLATATDTNGALLGFSFLKNVAKPALNGAVAVALPAFTAPGRTTVTASNLPGGLFSSSARLSALANESAFEMSNIGGALNDGGIAFPTATAFADAYQSTVTSQGQTTAGIVSQVFVRREATTAPASVTLPDFDFSTALPTLTSYTVTNPTPRPDVAITSAMPLTASDGGFVSLDWSSTAGSATWLFVVPGTMSSFKAPALPADATNFIPAANASANTAIFFDASQVPSYAAVKALPIPTQSGLDILNPNSGKPLPAAGNVRITRYLDKSKT